MPEKFYTSGQAALAVGVSSYRIPALLESGAIDGERTRTGRWRSAHGRSHGSKSMASLRFDDSRQSQPIPRVLKPMMKRRNPPKARRSPPSKKLIASKEQVIKLRNKAEALDLERQIRRTHRADSEDDLERAQSQKREQWMQHWFDYAMSRLPRGSNLHSQVHAKGCLTSRRSHPKYLSA